MPSPAGEVQVRSQQGSLGEKKSCAVQPVTCRVGLALNRAVADYRAGRTVGGLSPACSLHWLPFRSEGLWVEGASATMI